MDYWKCSNLKRAMLGRMQLFAWKCGESFQVSFKAGAEGFILHWSPGVVTNMNEGSVCCVTITQEDDHRVVLCVSDDFHFACFSSLRKRKGRQCKAVSVLIVVRLTMNQV